MLFINYVLCAMHFAMYNTISFRHGTCDLTASGVFGLLLLFWYIGAARCYCTFLLAGIGISTSFKGLLFGTVSFH